MSTGYKIIDQSASKNLIEMQIGSIGSIGEDVAAGYVHGKTKAQPSPNGVVI